MDGGEEFACADGFAHELVDARPRVATEVGGIEGFEAAGDDDDGQRLLGEAQLASERDAGDAGHLIIGDQEIVIVVGEEGPRGGAIGRGVDVKTLRLKDGGLQEAHDGIIVGDEDAGRGYGGSGDGRDGGKQTVESCYRSGREARSGASGGVGLGAESWRSRDGEMGEAEHVGGAAGLIAERLGGRRGGERRGGDGNVGLAGPLRAGDRRGEGARGERGIERRAHPTRGATTNGSARVAGYGGQGHRENGRALQGRKAADDRTG